MSGSLSTSSDGGSGSDPYGSSSISGSSESSDDDDGSDGHTTSSGDSHGDNSNDNDDPSTDGSDGHSENDNSNNKNRGRSSRRGNDVKSFRKEVKKYVEKYGCSKRKAKREVNKMRKKKMMKILYNLLEVKKLIYNEKDDLASPPSRLNKMDEIFNFAIENCENWRGLNDAINLANGNKKKKNNFSNVFNLDWPLGLLSLFFYNVLNYELEKILVNKVKKGKNEFELKIVMDKIRVEHSVLLKIFMEDIVLQGGETSAKQFLLEVLLLYLNPDNDRRLIEFYNKDKSRRYLIVNSGNNSNNNNNNNNNTTGKKRSYNNYNNSSGGRSIDSNLCYYFNFGTCRRGNSCAHKHICAVCVKPRHGASWCTTLMKKVKSNNDKKNKNSSYNNNDDGYNRGDYNRGNYGRNLRPRNDGREFNENNNWGSTSNPNVDAALQGLRLALQADGKTKSKNKK